MNQRTKNLAMAAVCALIIIVVAVAGYNIIGQPTLKRIFQMLGGNMPGGIIQFLTYLAFFWGMFEISSRFYKVKEEQSSFDMELLPEQEQWVLSPDDVNDLKIKMIEKEKEQSLLMVGIIKKAATKFRANKSISDVIEIVSTQVKINMTKSENAQSLIRYLAWAIPSIGFIGTILGIAESLGYADQASEPEGLAQVTAAMYVAFDTTLISLILSIIIMYFIHSLQEQEDELHMHMEEYVIENLVNRIHIE
jgi:biopolymer transport protein ExbB/TolQ